MLLLYLQSPPLCSGASLPEYLRVVVWSNQPGGPEIPGEVIEIDNESQIYVSKFPGEPWPWILTLPSTEYQSCKLSYKIVSGLITLVTA